MNTNTMLRGWFRSLALLVIICTLVSIILGHGMVSWIAYRANRLGVRCLWRVQTLATAVNDVIWVLIVWVDGRFQRVILRLRRMLRQLLSWGRVLVRAAVFWGLREFSDPVVCAGCVYLGVMSSSALPLAVLLHIMPLPLVGVVLSPLAAFAITTRVFDTRAYLRWQRGARGRLGARLLRAYSDGVMWWLWILPSPPRTGATA